MDSSSSSTSTLPRSLRRPDTRATVEILSRGLLVLALLGLFSPAAALAQTGRTIPRATKVTPSAAPTLSYKLTAHDVVNVVVFGEAELTTTTRIDKDGQIMVPMVGLVRIAGQNIRDAAKTLEAALREYLVKPQVSLTIVQYTKRRITILGQVNKPGTYELPDETSVNITEAIGMAGGFSRIASNKITIKRTKNGQEQILKIDAKSVSENDSSDRPLVEPGDTITVGERLF